MKYSEWFHENEIQSEVISIKVWVENATHEYNNQSDVQATQSGTRSEGPCAQTMQTKLFRENNESQNDPSDSSGPMNYKIMSLRDSPQR